jgi:hypothetical protein
MDLGTSGPTNINQNTSNIFVEAWVYFNSVTIAHRIFVRTPDATSGAGTVDIVFRTSGTTLYFNYGTGGIAGGASGPIALTAGRWYHVAMSSVPGGTSYVFIDGAPGTGYSPALDTYNSGYKTLIGAGGSDYSNMYIRDLRVVQGGIVPTTSFTPGSAPFSYTLPSYVTGSGSTVFTLLGQFITYVPGKYGSSLLMGGTSYLKYSTTLGYNLGTGGATFAMWFKLLAVPVGTNFWIFGASGTNYGDRIYILVGTSGLIGWTFIDNTLSGKGLNSPSQLVVGTWTHLTFTLFNGTMTMYINGSQVATRSDAPMSGVVLDTQFSIAALAGGSGNNINAEFDDFRIYQSALTAAQVRSVYSSQGAPAPGPVMPQPIYAFDFENTAVPYTGSLTTGIVGTGITYPSGKYSKCIDIPNSGGFQNRVDYNYSGSYSVDAGFSVAFWVKPYANGGSFLQFYGSAQSDGFGGGPHVTFMMQNSSGKARAQLYNYQAGVAGTGYNAAVSAATLSTSTFTHVAATIGNGVIILYINGVAEPIATYAKNGMTLSSYFRLGSADAWGPASAQYDDLRIFDRSLTFSQVQSVFNHQGMPGRGVQTKSPIQPGYIYEPYNNYTNIGNPDVKVLNSTNPDPRIYVDPASAQYSQWTADAGLLTKWNSMPFKYYILLDAVFSGTAINGLRFPVSIPVSGTYDVQIFIYGAGGNTDSAWIAMDGETAIQVGNVSTSWRNGLSAKSLTAGNHTLELYMREQMGIGGIRIIPTGESAPTLTAFRQNFTGTPLFTQLSPAARSSAVGAFSLRAVNGISARAVAVQAHPVGIWPPTVLSGFTTALSGQVYGSGTYTVSSSEIENGGGRASWNLFNIGTNNDLNGGYHSPTGSKVFTEGGGGPWTYLTTATGSTTISGVAIKGLWIQIQLPTSMTLKSYQIITRTGYTTSKIRLPANFYVVGSNDGTNWTQLDLQNYTVSSYNSIMTSIVVAGETRAQVTNTVSNTIAFLYYRLVVLSVTSSDGLLNFSNFWLYGDSPSYAPNAAQDFYADRLGNLLTAPVTGQSLANWLGGATGYVTTWYDQSGTNRAIQNTAANQPIIQKATKGPGYMVNFNGTSQFVTLSASYNFLNGTNITVNAVALRTATVTGPNYIIGTNSPTASYQRFFLGFNSDTSFAMPVTGNPPAITIPAYNASSEPVTYMTGGLTPSRVLYKNDTLGGTNVDANLLSVPSGYSYSIGYTVGAATYYYKGNLFELLIFTSALDQTQVTQIYQNQLSAYGT